MRSAFSSKMPLDPSPDAGELHSSSLMQLSHAPTLKRRVVVNIEQLFTEPQPIVVKSTF